MQQDSIRIRSAWDRTLTYDSLDRRGSAAQAPEDEPIFVGRESLLDPLIEAIADPETRGTFLISGYRGAGKTTLLIEALRRAKALLESKADAVLAGSVADAAHLATRMQEPAPVGDGGNWRLLPLVLNVSELSASLPADNGQTAAGLTIDPRRLLTALLRALMNRASLFPADGSVQNKVVETYNKANAAEYSRTASASQEQARALEQEASVSFDVKDVYKLAGGLSAGGVLVLEAMAWLGPTAAAMHAVAVVLAAASVASFRFSQKQSSREADRRELRTSLRFDNSLHQIETDLKDILAGLHTHRLRPVIVLEELDKLDDGEGKQLDAVIRYFKNLFTQAPGLFFFVTDKGYFDLVSSRIKKARRERSYAVEHTFFTHRIFVGRPSTRDCVSYLQRITAEPAANGRIAQYDGPLLTSRSTEASSDRLVLLIGAVLFRAANHLFDLKNELRRYVRRVAVGEGSETQLTFDGQFFTEDEAALAKFQGLIEMKARQYAFSPSRPYANEVLNDCLYAVFNELGSSRAQSISDFYPRQQSELLLDEQLDVTETERIKEAVASIVEDLQRGAAFIRDRKDLATGQFAWSPAAARGFRFVRRLETYEEEFVAELSKLSSQARRFGKGGPFAGITQPIDSDQVALGLDDRIGQIRDMTHSLGLEDAEIEKRERALEVNQVVDAAFAELLKRLQDRYGLPVRLRQTQGSQGIYVVGEGSEPLGRLSPSDTGALLLVLGEIPEMEAALRSVIGGAFNLERLALVHVIDDRGQQSAIEEQREKWTKELASIAEERASAQPPVPKPHCRVRVLALGEPYAAQSWPSLDLAALTLEQAWGEQAMCEVMFQATWVNPVWPRLASLAELRAGRVPPGYAGLIAAFDQWLASTEDLFWFTPPPSEQPALEPPVANLEAWLERRDAPNVFVINVFGAGGPPLAYPNAVLSGIEDHLRASLPGLQVVGGTFRRAAAIGVAIRRLIPGIDLRGPDPADEKGLHGLRVLLGTTGRLVLASDTLPDVFAGMTRTKYDAL